MGRVHTRPNGVRVDHYGRELCPTCDQPTRKCSACGVRRKSLDHYALDTWLCKGCARKVDNATRKAIRSILRFGRR